MTNPGRLARRTLIAATAATMGALGLAAPAHAFWRGGVFFPAPVVVVGPPPVYYAPPPAVVYAPPAPFGATCYAGVYACRLPALQPVGSGCACPGIGAPSYGSVR